MYYIENKRFDTKRGGGQIIFLFDICLDSILIKMFTKFELTRPAGSALKVSGGVKRGCGGVNIVSVPTILSH